MHAEQLFDIILRQLRVSTRQARDEHTPVILVMLQHRGKGVASQAKVEQDVMRATANYLGQVG